MTTSSQVAGIAQLLGVDANDVHGLIGVSDDDLDALHAQIADRSHADQRRRFARIAGLSQKIPRPIAGKLPSCWSRPRRATSSAGSRCDTWETWRSRSTRCAPKQSYGRFRPPEWARWLASCSTARSTSFAPIQAACRGDRLGAAATELLAAAAELPS